MREFAKSVTSAVAPKFTEEQWNNSLYLNQLSMTPHYSLCAPNHELFVLAYIAQPLINSIAEFVNLTKLFLCHLKAAICILSSLSQDIEKTAKEYK